MAWDSSITDIHLYVFTDKQQILIKDTNYGLQGNQQVLSNKPLDIPGQQVNQPVPYQWKNQQQMFSKSSI